MENFDVDVASNKLTNMSFQERSPLQVINSNSRPLEHAKKFGSETNEEREHIRFSKLVKKAKYLAQDGKVHEALELNEQVLQIHYHERIAKMEEYLKNYGDEDDEENSNMVELGAGFFLYRELYSKLYEHQKEGIMWLWGLHKKEKGGILGDDMGLGKTIQVISFLSGLFDMEKIKTALVVAPVSVMINWEKEFSKWAPGIAVHTFHGNSKRERERSLDRVHLRGGVLLTTYGMVVTSWEQLANKDGREFVWDYVILDEGHKIKNPTKTTKGIRAVGAKHRIIMTGTPVQNNLKELWVLFDYVHQGSLLGTLRTFKMEFENPIVRAREKDAKAGEKHLGMEMAQTLKDIIAPYFLRRTKGQVNHSSNAKNPSDKICKTSTKRKSSETSDIPSKKPKLVTESDSSRLHSSLLVGSVKSQVPAAKKESNSSSSDDSSDEKGKIKAAIVKAAAPAKAKPAKKSDISSSAYSSSDEDEKVKKAPSIPVTITKPQVKIPTVKGDAGSSNSSSSDSSSDEETGIKMALTPKAAIVPQKAQSKSPSMKKVQDDSSSSDSNSDSDDPTVKKVLTPKVVMPTAKPPINSFVATKKAESSSSDSSPSDEKAKQVANTPKSILKVNISGVKKEDTSSSESSSEDEKIPKKDHPSLKAATSVRTSLNAQASKRRKVVPVVIHLQKRKQAKIPQWCHQQKSQKETHLL